MLTVSSSPIDVLFRCDGGSLVGLGHVKRCIAIAAVLRQRYGLTSALSGTFDKTALAVIDASDIAVMHSSSEFDEETWIDRHLDVHRPRVLICDIRTDLSPRALMRLKRKLALLITLDDASDRRLVSDIALLPPTADALDLLWPDFKGEALIGWAWVVLATPPVMRKDVRALREPPYQLLVTMGGADPAGLTLRIARNLRVFGENIMPHFVIGPAFSDPERTAAALLGMWPCGRIYRNLPDLGDPMREADLAICAYGVTAQELAAAGVPALYIALSDDHAQAADALAATGAGQNLGVHGDLADEDFRMHVSRLLRNAQSRERMSVAGPRSIDGRGAERIAERVMRAMNAKAA